MKQRLHLIIWLLLGLALLTGPAQAQRSQSFGSYQLHYNALPSGALNPQMAREHGVVRSRGRGVLLIAVQHEGQSVEAIVNVSATNSRNEDVAITLRRLRTNGHASYLGSFPISHGETLRFQLQVIPQGSSEALHAGFSQQFFTD